MSNNSLWNWHDMGFFTKPISLPLFRRILVHRVWGGTSTETGSPIQPGVCFTFEKPDSRWRAEGLLAIMEWGNSCRFLTTFEILPGAKIFVGKVHPGDFYQSGLGSPGSQVFVETAQMNKFVRRVGVKQVLRDDVGSHVVVPNRDPSKAGGGWDHNA